MGEEGTDIRLMIHDKDIEMLKTKIDVIKESNIEIKILVKQILDLYIVVRNTVIGFVIINILGMIWAFKSK